VSDPQGVQASIPSTPTDPITGEPSGAPRLPPVVIEPMGGNRYKVLVDYVHVREHEGTTYRLTIPAGFQCDLASVPRILWWWISPFDLGAAAIPHDWIYSHGGKLPDGSHQKLVNGTWENLPQAWTREEADRLFARMMRDVGVPRFMRRRAYNAVRLFGGGAWKG
jgi:hypothetical protein